MSNMNDIPLINKQFGTMRISKYKIRILVGHYPKGSEWESLCRSAYFIKDSGIIWKARILGITPAPATFSGPRTSVGSSKKKALEMLKKSIEENFKFKK